MSSFFDDKLSQYQQQWININNAINALVSGNGAVEFELDDGQVRQNVRKSDLDKLQAMKTELEWNIRDLEGSIPGGFYAEPLQ